MKKIFLSLLLLATIESTFGQNPNLPGDYIPFHNQLKNRNATSPQQYGHRDLEWEVVADREDIWNNGSWLHKDSTQYFYNANAQETFKHGYKYTSDVWTDAFNTMYTYDADGHNTGILGQSWVPHLNTYRNHIQQLYTYDNYGDQICYLFQSWDTISNTWVSNYKTTYTYDNNHHVIEYISQNWNTDSGLYENWSRVLTTYNSSGNVKSYLEHVWFIDDWKISYLDTIIYDTSNQLKSVLRTYRNYDLNTWIPLHQYNYTFDQNGNFIEWDVFFWNNTTNVWDNMYHYTFTYNNDNKVIEFLRTGWNSIEGMFEKLALDTYTWDINGDQIQHERFNWNKSTETWDPYNRYSYSYDDHHNTLYELDETYDMNFLSYVNLNQFFFYYQSFNVDVPLIRNELGAMVFPNPVLSSIHLTFSIANSSDVSIRLFDAMGRIINSQSKPVVSGPNTVDMDIEHVPPGNYYLHISDLNSNKSSVLAIVKQ